MGLCTMFPSQHGEIIVAALKDINLLINAVMEKPSILPEVCEHLDANRIIELVRELTDRGFTVPTALVDDCVKRAPEVEDWLCDLDKSNAIRTKTPDTLQATLELTTEPIEPPVVLDNNHSPPMDLTTDFAEQAPETTPSLFEHIHAEG